MLPVGVLLPTLDSMAYLPGHLEAATGWLDAVEQVIVVDSHSKDGTVEFLKANLRHPNLQILSHPPGLYESWNFAIAKLNTKFAYISTIGDIITLTGLKHLVEAAEHTHCDVVISPPEFVYHDPTTASIRRWPVHELIADLGITELQVIDRLTVFFYACLHALGSNFAGLLGSCASNLFRTASLQAHPFPVECGRAGDTGWAFLHSLDSVFAVTPFVCASFLWHPKPLGPNSEFYAKVADNFCAEVVPALRRELDRDPVTKAACAQLGIDEFLTQLQVLRHNHNTLLRYRDGWFPWFLCPAAWKARANRELPRLWLTEFKKRFLAFHKVSRPETSRGHRLPSRTG